MGSKWDGKTVGVDFDGVLHEHDHYVAVHGKVDTSLITELHRAGYAVAVITANNVGMVATTLRKNGVRVLADEKCQQGHWNGGKDGKLVLVTNRKVAAMMYVDDRAHRFEYGRDVKSVISELRYRYGFTSCESGKHWGPHGAAGVLPYVVVDGQVKVLLGKRSYRVSQGGTWGGFGGALEEGESPWEGAVRELGEEVTISFNAATDYHAVREVYEYRCKTCKWSYVTYLVELDGRQGVPGVVIKDKKETDLLSWVSVGSVDWYNLHPGFTSAWPVLAAYLRGQYPEETRYREPRGSSDPRTHLPYRQWWEEEEPDIFADEPDEDDPAKDQLGYDELADFLAEEYPGEFPVDPAELEQYLKDHPKLFPLT